MEISKRYNSVFVKDC